MFGGYPPTSLAPNNCGGNGSASLIGGCSSAASLVGAAGDTALCNARIPVIPFDANGTPYSFSDTGHILDTGQWDFVNHSAYGEDGNESINWNVAGTEAIRGGSAPEPATWALMVMPLGSSCSRTGSAGYKGKISSRWGLKSMRRFCS